MFDEKTVVFVCRVCSRRILAMIPPFERHLKVSGYSPVRVDEGDLREILQEGKALPKAVVVFAFGDAYIYLVDSLIAEFPSLHVIYWLIPLVDSVPPKDARVHLFSGILPSDLVAILEEC